MIKEKSIFGLCIVIAVVDSIGEITGNLSTRCLNSTRTLAVSALFFGPSKPMTAGRTFFYDTFSVPIVGLTRHKHISPHPVEPGDRRAWLEIPLEYAEHGGLLLLVHNVVIIKLSFGSLPG